MKQEWRKSELTTLGQLASKNINNFNKGFPVPAEYELTISGYYGEIWEKNDKEINLFITNTTRAKRFAEKLGIGLQCKKGDEPFFTVPKTMLPDAIIAIKTPKSHITRVRLANSFRLSK